MKNQFHGYFRPSEEDFKKLWDTCIFTFDTSALLNLYEFSPDSSQEILKLLGRLKEQDRLWLSHRAAEEYLKLRRSIISDQLDKYDDFRGRLQAITQSLKSKAEHPFVQTETVAQFEVVAALIESDLKAQETKHRALLADDPLLASLVQLFEGRVGEDYPEKRRAEICADGKRRYERKIPPGYCDIKKPGDSAYGDLIIWQQLLDKAKADKKGMILIINDQSEDWWFLHEKSTVGPRPELIQEMRSYSDASFYMYRTEAFMAHAATYLNQSVKQEAIDDVKQVLDFKQEAKAYVLHAEPGNYELDPRNSPRLLMLEAFGSLAKRINTWGSKVAANKLSEDDAVQALATYLRELHVFTNRWHRHMPQAVVNQLENVLINCETLIPLPIELRNPKVEGFVRRVRDFYETLTKDWE